MCCEPFGRGNRYDAISKGPEQKGDVKSTGSSPASVILGRFHALLLAARHCGHVYVCVWRGIWMRER